MADSGDLRSEAREAQRVRNHNHKWARGGRTAPGKPRCPHLGGMSICADCWGRPQPPGVERRWYTWALDKSLSHNRRDKSVVPSKRSRKDDFFGPVGSSDSSAAEEEMDHHVSTADEADAQIMYSYDAPAGPSGGSQILGFAVSQAVERFENQQTEKLAQEYEFVDSRDGYPADTEDDDFEIINEASTH